MPFPSTGNAYNAAAFMRVLGEEVTLDDSSTIMVYLREHTYPSELDDGQAQLRATHVMHLPASGRGTLLEKQFVHARGKSYYVTSITEDEDSWLRVVMNLREVHA